MFIGIYKRKRNDEGIVSYHLGLAQRPNPTDTHIKTRSLVERVCFILGL